jgi:endonuclease YncB( thermonuclease family)
VSRRRKVGWSPLVASLGIVGAAGGAVATERCDLSPGPLHTVTAVIDVETLRLDDGAPLRLAAITVPRERDVGGVPGAAWAPEAAARAWLEAEAVGRSVQLRFDRQRRDRHGQTVGFADVVSTPLAIPGADGRAGMDSLQAGLLRAGLARVEAIRDQRGCLSSLLAAEALARAEGRGLWSEAAYRVRAIDAGSDLRSFVGSFKILTGTVASVEDRRDGWRILLGRTRRPALTIHVRRDDRDTLGRFGGELTSLRGQAVEARGWLATGPASRIEIDLSTVGHLRVQVPP